MTGTSLNKKRREVKKFLEPNENKNTVYQNLWDTTKFIAKSAYI
jgi:hypothetical protein